jgi:uncharacterized membrane protein
MGMSIDTATTTSDGHGPPTATALGAAVRPRAETLASYQRRADDDRGTGGESTADLLGYFSIGLGLAEFLAPDVMARLVGVKHPDDGTRATMRVMGLREIGHGVGILSHQQPRKAVWSRVVGDALDIALLARTAANPENDRGRTLFATVNVLAVTALDVMTAKQLSQQPRTAAREAMEQGVVRTKRSVTVRKSPAECYAFWRDFENLPRFMRHLESVTVTGGSRSHWVAKAPAGRTVEWDAETTEDVPNERIAWRSVEGSGVRNAGVVEFAPAPGGRGTEVRVTLEYDPPAGRLGQLVAKLFGEDPATQVREDLRRFKAVMEAGEAPTSDVRPADRADVT